MRGVWHDGNFHDEFLQGLPPASLGCDSGETGLFVAAFCSFYFLPSISSQPLARQLAKLMSRLGSSSQTGLPGKGEAEECSLFLAHKPVEHESSSRDFTALRPLFRRGYARGCCRGCDRCRRRIRKSALPSRRICGPRRLRRRASRIDSLPFLDRVGQARLDLGAPLFASARSRPGSAHRRSRARCPSRCIRRNTRCAWCRSLGVDVP